MQTSWQAGRQAGRQAGWLAGWQAGRLAGRQAGRQAGRLAGWQAGRLAGRQAGWQTHTHICEHQTNRSTTNSVLGKLHSTWRCLLFIVWSAVVVVVVDSFCILAVVGCRFLWVCVVL